MSNPDHLVMGVDFIVGDIMEDPPVCPEGFERAKDNEYVLLRKLCECSARDTRTTEKPCCGQIEHIYCKRINGIVTRKRCLDCDNPISARGGNHATRTRVSENI